MSCTFSPYHLGTIFQVYEEMEDSAKYRSKSQKRNFLPKLFRILTPNVLITMDCETWNAKSTPLFEISSHDRQSTRRDDSRQSDRAVSKKKTAKHEKTNHKPLPPINNTIKRKNQ